MNPIRILIAASVLACAGCSSDSEPKPEPQPVELKTTEGPPSDTPEAILFREGKRLYRAGLYTIAVDTFESLRVNYPLSPYVEFADLKIADARFELRDFAVAATAYEEFAKNHPASPSVPYVLMRAGNSYRMTNRGIGRDTTPLEKAQALFTRLLKEYPDSIYAAQAKVFLSETDQALLDYQNFVIDFYAKMGNEKAVEARKRQFAEKSKAYEEVKLAADQASEPTRAFETAAAQDYLAAPTLLTAQRPAAQESVLSEARASQAQSPDTAHPGLLIADAQEMLTLDIQRVNCRDQKIFLYLREPIKDQNFLSRFKTVSPQSGKVTLPLPDMAARQTTLDCFGSGDLSVSSKGELTLISDHAWDVMPLDFPPRLLLVEK